MAEITMRFNPTYNSVERVRVTMDPGETTLGLYLAKHVVENYISKGIPVEIHSGSFSLFVHQGIYILSRGGNKLASIALLRAFSSHVYVGGRKREAD